MTATRPILRGVLFFLLIGGQYSVARASQEGKKQESAVNNPFCLDAMTSLTRVAIASDGEREMLSELYKSLPSERELLRVKAKYPLWPAAFFTTRFWKEIILSELPPEMGVPKRQVLYARVLLRPELGTIDRGLIPMGVLLIDNPLTLSYYNLKDDSDTRPNGHNSLRLSEGTEQTLTVLLGDPQGYYPSDKFSDTQQNVRYLLAYQEVSHPPALFVDDLITWSSVGYFYISYRGQGKDRKILLHNPHNHHEVTFLIGGKKLMDVAEPLLKAILGERPHPVNTVNHNLMEP